MSRQRTYNLTPAQRKAAQGIFLATLATGLSVSAAAERAGVSRTIIYAWKHKFPGFSRDWEEAWETGKDSLIAEAHRRGVEGVEKPIFHQGIEIARIREYSDTLLLALLKARVKEFREASRIEVSGPQGGPVPIQMQDRRQELRQEIERIRSRN